MFGGPKGPCRRSIKGPLRDTHTRVEGKELKKIKEIVKI
jgi:hypothetical protein